MAEPAGAGSYRQCAADPALRGDRGSRGQPGAAPCGRATFGDRVTVRYPSAPERVCGDRRRRLQRARAALLRKAANRCSTPAYARSPAASCSADTSASARDRGRSSARAKGAPAEERGKATFASYEPADCQGDAARQA